MSTGAIRLAIDVGGTFTDLVVDDAGRTSIHKSSTTPDDPVEGMLDAIDLAAAERDWSRSRLLGEVSVLTHATTRAINAILTDHTARTALLTTEGHRDVLVFREGGRTGPFDFSRPYPGPYVPRRLTYEVAERIGADGSVVAPLDPDSVHLIATELRGQEVESVAVCLLWAIANPSHELEVERILTEACPGLPVTLSHRVNPTIREYRRASSAAIDASLKPLMTGYLEGMERRLRDEGLKGRLLIVTSTGGVAEVGSVAAAPILSVNSGPSMAPVAGRYHARLAAERETAIVADTGGTSFDVSLVRGGRIPRTRESWIGEQYYGHITGLSAIDVSSIGAGGGSVAWVDGGGLLHVGPQSAGSVPGPACYGRGGERPTVTDASLVLGYLDPDYFLGGAMRLDKEAAERAVASDVAAPLGMEPEEAAAAILRLATSHMVRAIEDLTVSQGIDPGAAVLVGGGGAAGLSAVAIATRLGCPSVIVPPTGAALSAAGALLSDLRMEAERHFVTSTAAFDFEGAARTVAELREQCEHFAEEARGIAQESRVELSVEARYPEQVWELEVPIDAAGITGNQQLRELEQAFHALHRQLFAIAEPDSPVEVIGWRAGAVSSFAPRPAEEAPAPAAAPEDEEGPGPRSRRIAFAESGPASARVVRLEELRDEDGVPGPAVVESPFTTVIVDPGAIARGAADGGIVIETLAARGKGGARAGGGDGDRDRLGGARG